MRKICAEYHISRADEVTQISNEIAAEVEGRVLFLEDVGNPGIDPTLRIREGCVVSINNMILN